MGKHTEESRLRANSTSLLVRHPLLVCLEGSESNGHLGHDTRDDGTKTLVETKRSLALDDFCAGGDETSRFDLRCTLEADVAMDHHL